MLDELRRLIELAWARIAALLQAAPPGSLQLTGVLGLATLVAAYYHVRGRDGGGGSGSGSGGSGGASGSGSSAQQRPAGSPAVVGGAGGVAAVGSGGGGVLYAQAAGPDGAHQRAAAKRAVGGPAGAAGASAAAARGGPSPQAASAAADDTPLAAAVRARLGGARRVTVSAPGVLLEQWDAAELQEAAAPRAPAITALRELCRRAEVFLIAHVADDVGAALVSGALEAAGAVGTGDASAGGGAVAPQRLLLCGTEAGKVSIVRQLEPDLHVDASVRTVSDLQRFVPRLLLVPRGGARAAPEALAAAANVEAADGLAEYFGVAAAAAAAARSS